MTFEVIAENGKSRTVDDEDKAYEIKSDMEGIGLSVEVNEIEQTDGGAEVVDTDGEVKQSRATQPEKYENDGDSDELTDVAQFQQDPISYLKSINTEFVNRIKGTPSISKRGFRFMQAELGISTSSELVATFDDPMGVVIHARAEMPDGRYAEAHGEGYLTESDVSDNEFVRYGDTRAKNRAISDLTSSGALAESELTE